MRIKMKSKMILSIIIMIFTLLSCNSEMIDKGISSMEDPRVPEINVKQGQDGIPSGSEYALGLGNGVRVSETSGQILFTIENTGTGELIMEDIIISGENPGEFTITEQPGDLILLPGSNTSFSIEFSPLDTAPKSAVLTIASNDFDESEYSFTVTARSIPLPDFFARLKTGYNPLAVEFRDNSLGTVSSYEWDFDGNGTIDSTLQNPSYTYYIPGTYTPVLTVRGPGGSDYIIKTAYITVHGPVKHAIDSSGADFIYACDLDKVGDIDIASATGGVTAWYENSSGSFTFHEVDNVFSAVNRVTAADLTGDGYNDIIASSVDTFEVVFFKNNQNKTFNSHVTIAGCDNPSAIQAADLNSDSRADVISSSMDNLKLHWSANTSDPESPSPWAGFYTIDNIWTKSISAAVINSDIYPDIVCAGSLDYVDTQGQIAWIKNDGTPDNGGWVKTEIDSTIAGPSSVFTADIDNDGDKDIIGAGKASHEIAWWENTDGEGAFGGKNRVTAAFPGASSVWAEDVNGDNNIDIIGSAEYSGEIAVWLNTGGMNLVKLLVAGDFRSPVAVSSADLNGDSKNDIIACGSEEIAWWDLNPPDIWNRHLVASYYSMPIALAAGDIDGDGRIDVISGSTDISWWKNSGEGGFGAKTAIETVLPTIVSLSAADLDNDNDLDILCAYTDVTDSWGISWWENTDGRGNFSGEKLIDTATNALTSASAFDVDRDGYLDIVCSANDTTTGIAWWKNNGDKTFGNMVQADDIAALLARAAYINNDSKTDIIYADQNTIKCLVNNGSNLFTSEVVITPDFSFWSGDTIAKILGCNIDGDTDMDVIAISRSTTSGAKLAWFENSSGGTAWTEHEIHYPFCGGFSFDVGDIDNDGDIDIFSTAYADSRILWWENIGGTPPQFSMHEVDGDFDSPRVTAAGDVDNDGDIDIISAADTNNKISWWENNIKAYGP